MLSRVVRGSGRCLIARRAYVTFPDIPVLPPNGPQRTKREDDAVPPMLPPDMSILSERTEPSKESSSTHSDNTPKQAPYGTEPILIIDEPAPIKQTHKLRNTLLAAIFGGAVLFGAGVYGSLQNDSIYDLFTDYVPYGEDAVLYWQEREFRQRYPQAHSHVSKANGRSSAPNVFIPQSGAVTKIREPEKRTEAKILQTGPQNSALKEEDKATPGTANYAPEVNKTSASKQAAPSSQNSVREKAPEEAGLDKTGKLPQAKPVQSPQQARVIPSKPSQAETKTSANAKAPKVEPVPPPSAPIKTFDIPKANDKSIERLQFAINGVIKAANEYGSSSFFQASLENAKDEVLLLNDQIAKVQAQEQLKAEQKLTEQTREFSQLQQQHINEVNSQIAEYERQLSTKLEQERDRLNQAYTERLAEEVNRIGALSEQKLQNELISQAIELQKKLKSEVRSRLEEERSGRLGKLENLQKSIAELKQLNVDSSSFIDERAKLQELEVALNALKNVLHEPVPRPFLRELAAVKEIAGSDELLRATIDTIDRDSYAGGVPTSGQIADRFRSVAEEVRKASLLPEGAGVAGHATSWLLSKVMFRKRGMVPGDDIEAVIARTEAHLEANDLDSALREMNALKGWAHIIAGDWLKMARRYLELQQSIELMENSAILRALKTQS